MAPVSEFQFGAVATETIEDALLHLAQQNEQAVKESAGCMGSFRETRIVGVHAGPGSWVFSGGGGRETGASASEAPILRVSVVY